MLYKQTNKHHTIKSLALLCSLSLMFGCSPDINHATGMPNETSILSNVQTKMNQSSFEVYTGRVAISLNPGMTGHSKRDAISFVQSESFQIQAQKKAKPNPAPHKQVQPLLDCVQANDNGSHTAHFSYYNSGSQTIDFPIGENNYFHHGSKDKGQPTTFGTGEGTHYPNATFQVDFDKANLVWTLNGSTVTATKNGSPACDNTLPPTEPIGFNPADPQQLAELYPDVPGNQDIAIPETESALIRMNNHAANPVATGQALIKIAEPVSTNLAQLEQEFGLVILDGPTSNGFYLVMPDMTKVSLVNLADNLQTINVTRNDAYQLQSVELGNLEAARTLAFVAEMMLRPEITGIGFNPKLEPQTTAPVETFESQLRYPGLPDVYYPFRYDNPFGSHRLWHLNEQSTHINQAWNLSLGYNMEQQKPVKVAVIDVGFGGILEHSSPGRDMEGQFLLDEGKIIAIEGQKYTTKNWHLGTLNYESGNAKSGDTRSIATRNHGMAASSLIAAHINDGNGLAGVAPGAKIIPFKMQPFDWYSATKALEIAIDDAHADVVSMSLGGSLPDPFTYDWADYKDNEKWYAYMQSVLQKADTQQTIVVASAGNGGWPVEHSIFAGRTYDNSSQRVFPQVITVGATQLDSAAPGEMEVANFANGDPTKLGSNWGNIDIWAPGKYMITLGSCCNEEGYPFVDSDGNRENSAVYGAEGTSMAAPVVAGIAALMKARLPYLDRNTFIQKLQTESPYQRRYSEPDIRTEPQYETGKTCGSLQNMNCGEPFSPSKKVEITVPNAYAALDAISNDTAQTFTGTLEQINGKLYLSGINDNLLSWSGNEDPEFIKRFSATALNGEAVLIDGLLGASVRVDGWKKGNTIYILQMRQAPTIAQQCVEHEIVSDTTWFGDAPGQPSAYIVPEYLDKVTIPPSTNGSTAKPIMSDAIAKCGTGDSSNLCLKFHVYHYSIPADYKVTEAEVWLQGNLAQLYFNGGQWFSPMVYSGFETGLYSHVLLTPAEIQTAFQSSTLPQVFVASLLVDENGALSADGTYGPFAAKVRIKACTP